MWSEPRARKLARSREAATPSAAVSSAAHPFMGSGNSSSACCGEACCRRAHGLVCGAARRDRLMSAATVTSPIAMGPQDHVQKNRSNAAHPLLSTLSGPSPSRRIQLKTPTIPQNPRAVVRSGSRRVRIPFDSSRPWPRRKGRARRSAVDCGERGHCGSTARMASECMRGPSGRGATGRCRSSWQRNRQESSARPARGREYRAGCASSPWWRSRSG